MADQQSGGSGISSEFWKGAAGAVGAGLVGWAVTQWTPVWAWIKGAASATWAHLGAASYPNWSWYLFATISVVAITGAMLRRRSRSANDYSRFAKLAMFNAVWRWQYYGGSPSSLYPFCPVCDTQLTHMGNRSSLFSSDGHRVECICRRCNEVRINEPGHLSELEERVKLEVQRLLRNGEWRQHVQRAMPK